MTRLTTNYQWPVPELTDEPDGPGQIGALADQVDADLKELADAVDALPGGGGGGSGAAAGGRFVATDAQAIGPTGSGKGTVVGFPSLGANMTGAATEVTREAAGSGHRFVLGAAGLWSAHATIRVGANSAAGELSAGIWADLDGGTDYDFNVAHDGGRREGLPRTLTPGAETFLPEGAALVVYVFNGTGSSRNLEPASGAWVHLDLWLKG